MFDGAVNVLTDDVSISRIGVPWLHSAEQRPQRHSPNCPYSNRTPRQQRLLRPVESRLRGAIARGQRSLAAAGAGQQG